MARDNDGLVLGGEKATLQTPDVIAARIQVWLLLQGDELRPCQGGGDAGQGDEGQTEELEQEVYLVLELKQLI